MAQKEDKRQTQLQFTPTPELRRVLEAEAKERGLSLSAFIRTNLLNVFHDEVEELIKQKAGS